MNTDSISHRNFFNKTTPRNFGVLFTVIFLFASLYTYRQQLPEYYVLLFSFGTLFFFMTTCFCPRLLSFLQHLWNRLGELLSAVVNPIVLGLLFFLIVTPIGLFFRLLGRDTLKLRKHAASTYWVNKTHLSANIVDFFKHQF